MELEKHWQQVFSDRARRFTTPHEISHWTEKGFRLRFRRFTAEIKQRHVPGERVLDLGCGPGFYASLFKRPVLVDYAPAVFAHLPKDHDGLPVCGDFTSLPFRDRTFDGLLCVGLLQCHRLTRAHLRGLARVLKPGGWFVFETLNSECGALMDNLPARKKTVLRDFNAAPGRRSHCVLDDFVVYQAESLARWFTDAGLHVELFRFIYPVGTGRFLPTAIRRYAKSFYLTGRREEEA
ncbi:MAG: class I SAM-dependent methyltransferase [Fibrobacterota bacterium]